jgi:hypothetical protein
MEPILLEAFRDQCGFRLPSGICVEEKNSLEHEFITGLSVYKEKDR